MSTTRKYELKRRAERMEETRLRIVEAAVELHSTIGPSRTTIAALAERAGVGRPTVYHHFPDEESLFRACSGHVFSLDPLPDPASWRRVADPEERLGLGLRELYGWYRRHRTLVANLIRDAPRMPIVYEVSVPMFGALEEMRRVLSAGWKVSGGRRRQLLALLGHSLEFSTWESLAERQGLGDEASAEAVVALASCLAGKQPTR